MDCSTFEKHQTGFVDGTLPDALVVEMQLHLSECPRCSRRDTALRRGLMVLRNMPAIEPSPDFTARLEARLREGEAPAQPNTRFRASAVSGLAAVALGVFAAGYFALGSYPPVDEGVPMLAPVVATQPEAFPTHFFDHVMAMPASAGLNMWSSAMLIDQGPVQLMTAEFDVAEWFRGR
jgi:anti-sigma factor RsiW